MLLILPHFTIIKRLFIIPRDRKKKRFVREVGKEDHKKKIKTDGGQVIANKKNRKNLYPLCVLIRFYCSLTLTICSCDVETLCPLTICEVTRSGRKSTSLTTVELDQMEKKEEDEEGGDQEEVREHLVVN